jgi:hypothetical protein
MKTADRLKRVFALFLEIVKRDPNLASEIDRVLGQTTSSSQAATAARTSPSSNRRKPAAFDPFVVHEEGEAALRARLAELDVEALKDIVAEHGMDSANLVLKWKTRERIVNHIVSTVQSRSKKGDAFRS